MTAPAAQAYDAAAAARREDGVSRPPADSSLRLRALWPVRVRDVADPAEAPHRTQAIIAQMTAVVRIVQLAPWPIAIALGSESGIQRPWLAALAYGLQTGWSLVWATLALTRRAIATWSMTIDVAVASVALVLAGMACYPQDATTWANSAVAPAMGTAVAAAAAWPVAASSLSGLILAGSYVLGVARGLEYSSNTAIASTVGNVCSLVGFGVIAGLVSHYLRAQAESAAAAAVELAAARARSAAEQSRERERTRQYRMLHDTVLSTLSALARGGLDPNDLLVRQRCAADADYLRGLISSGGISAGNQLQGELASVGRSQAALGLRVHVHCAEVPPDLPPQVVQALTDACREALNNVIKHSGVDQAWVTALGHDSSALGLAGDTGAFADDPHTAHGVVVTITDRGRGFDPSAARKGLGLRESIAGRMAEAGGAAHVDSSPNQGTTVELRWPA